VLGETISFFTPIICISLTLHTGSSSVCVRSETLDVGLERPDSVDDAGEEERGDVVYTLRRLKSLYSVLRFTHVPPNSRVTTTRGSMNAPAPMILTNMQVLRVVGRRERVECGGSDYRGLENVM
jgi:hypothetical protein